GVSVRILRNLASHTSRSSAKGRCQSLLQYLLISFDIADIATRNLNRRLQKRLAIMRYVIANLFVFFFGGGGINRHISTIYCDNPRIFDD
ncbi:hypothetical protein, partial [Bifidobacterium pseudocatenulatum]|uniref:hypothetical protein n=1 Tax=Bifidobacterium pseudocatenulatum TaxID=28026 RepID=UPI0022E151D2